MHRTDGRGKHVNRRGLYKLPCLFSRCKRAHVGRCRRMNGGRSANVANLAFDDNPRVNRFDGFYCFLSLLHVFIQSMRGRIENHHVEPRLCCLYCLFQ